MIILFSIILVHLCHASVDPNYFDPPKLGFDFVYQESQKLIRDQEHILSSALSIENLRKTYGDHIVRNLATYEEDNGTISSKKFRGKTIMGSEQIKFYLYNNKSCGIQLKIGNIKNLIQSGFNLKAPTKIICHGFMSNYQVGPGGILHEAYMSTIKTMGYNIILVDWWNLAGATKPKVQKEGLWELTYFPAAQNTKIVGIQTARFIDFLVNESGASLSQFHLIGHSLGSHAMGWAGRSIHGFPYELKVARITGLDPAKPCFETNFSILCFIGAYIPLDKESAHFVDVIHTHTRLLGYSKPLGHADFYPNSGSVQPGCGDLTNIFLPCSHSRSIHYFAESIKVTFGFKSWKCQNWNQFHNGQCQNGVWATMGEACPLNARGTFYLETYSQQPYSKL